MTFTTEMSPSEQRAHAIVKEFMEAGFTEKQAYFIINFFSAWLPIV